jgi:hypothetical protein
MENCHAPKLGCGDSSVAEEITAGTAILHDAHRRHLTAEKHLPSARAIRAGAAEATQRQTLRCGSKPETAPQ